ncbi:MAG: phage head-tail joining protein [Hyphomicrobiaceae bacterium]
MARLVHASRRVTSDLAQLTAWRHAQMAARSRGVRTVEYDGKRVTYATDGEMAATLADLDRKIAAAGGGRPTHEPGAHQLIEWNVTMKSHIQGGRMITAAVPAGGVASGDGVIVGALLGVAAFTAAEDEAVEIARRGVYLLPKNPTAVRTLGARVAWDAAEKRIDLPGTGFYPVGIATEAAGDGVTTVRVRLDGVAT